MPTKKRSTPSTPAKKKVGSQRFCTERQFKLIDPVWVNSQVPNHFWQDIHNRRNFLRWLGWDTWLSSNGRFLSIDL